MKRREFIRNAAGLLVPAGLASAAPVGTMIGGSASRLYVEPGEGGGSNITQIEGQDATDVLDARIAAQLATYDPPTRAEMTSDKEEVLAAISGLNDLSTSDIRGIAVEPNNNRTLGCYLAAAGAILFGTSSTTDGETEYRDPSGTSVRVTGTASAAGTRSASITCPTY